MPGYQVYEWNAIFAPAGTPPAIVNRLQSEIAKVVRIPEVREQTASWAKVVRAGNIKAE